QVDVAVRRCQIECTADVERRNRTIDAPSADAGVHTLDSNGPDRRLRVDADAGRNLDDQARRGVGGAMEEAEEAQERVRALALVSLRAAASAGAPHGADVDITSIAGARDLEVDVARATATPAPASGHLHHGPGHGHDGDKSRAIADVQRAARRKLLG